MAISKPGIAHRNKSYFLVDENGDRWRVYDTNEHPTTHFRALRGVRSFGDPASTARCFIPPDKAAAHYAFTFQCDADRGVSIELLVSQLRSATPFYRQPYARHEPRPARSKVRRTRR